MTLPLDSELADLQQSFAAATFVEGGLLVHLPSGDFFGLDEKGAAVWTVILDRTSIEEAVASLAAASGLGPSDAHALVQSWVDRARKMCGCPPTGIPRFDDDEQTLSLRDGDRTLLSYDKHSGLLSAGQGLRGATDDRIAEALRIFAPKIFARWFRLTLHASAVRLGDRVILFSGDSGAGKTTTARVLAGLLAQNRVICEDVVTLSGRGEVLSITDGAEACIQNWLSDATEALVVQRSDAISIEPLRHALLAVDRRLSPHKIIFLDGARRNGSTWALGPLSRPGVLALLFRHSFLYSADVRAVRSHLDSCRTLTAQLQGTEALAIPDGIATLETASRDQIETIAS